MNKNPENSRVALIACQAWFHEQIGGAFKIATDLAEYLCARGYRVCYVCGSGSGGNTNPTVERGVEVWRYRLPTIPSPHPANLAAHIRGAYRITREILRKHHLLCVSGHSPLQFLGASLAAGHRCRSAYSVHSPFAEELRHNWSNGRPSVRQRMAVEIARRLEGVNCRRAEVVQSDSRFTMNTLRALYGSTVAAKTLVSPGWVDVERFRPVGDRHAARRGLGVCWDTALPVFFCVRRLEPRMGLEQLVEAAAILQQEGLRFRVLIGGGGSLEGKLREMVGQNGLGETVHLLGRIPDTQLPLCFAAADCFVLPTKALECFGLIVLESYACGTPVIGTPVGAIPELVNCHGSEWLTAGTDGHAIADRMAAFLRGALPVDRAAIRMLAERWSSERGLAALAEIVVPGLSS